MIALLTTPSCARACTQAHTLMRSQGISQSVSFLRAYLSPPCLPRYPGKSLVGPISLLFGKSWLYSSTLWFWYPWLCPLHPIGQSHHSWSSPQGQDFTMLLKVKHCNHWVFIDYRSTILIMQDSPMRKMKLGENAQVARYKPMSISLLRLCSF